MLSCLIYSLCLIVIKTNREFVLMATSKMESNWGSSFRLIAAEKWKAKSAAMGRDVTEALVDYARPQPGMKVLDLASGTGEPAITIASRIGFQGHVTALDLSFELLEIAAQRARQRGLSNVSFQQADAHHFPFRITLLTLRPAASG